jgi:hypothetical protein
MACNCALPEKKRCSGCSEQKCVRTGLGSIPEADARQREKSRGPRLFGVAAPQNERKNEAATGKEGQERWKPNCKSIQAEQIRRQADCQIV